MLSRISFASLVLSPNCTASEARHNYVFACREADLSNSQLKMAGFDLATVTAL